ncbi:MAG: hypothetical protein H6736_14240 [Alphaproteobacteria bacterium]|nr:hypothetical protein [Alphaproteobacteria bacterium]
MSALLLLLACDPLSPVAREEAVWWGPTAAIEAREGIDLVELPAGEPVGYWPRIVVYADRIEVDTRAWWLSVPPSAYDALGRQGVLEAMVASKVVASVVDGQVPADQKRAQLITGLYEVLLAQAEARKALAERVGDPAFGLDEQILIVPDASTTAALLREALYTAGQAQLFSGTLGGSVDGRLRSAAASSDGACVQTVLVQVGRDGVHLSAGPPILAGDTCPLAARDLPDAFARLTGACADLYDAEAAAAAEAHPTVTLDPAEWRCTRVLSFLGGDVPASEVLPVLATLHTLHPDVRQGPFIGGFDAPGPDACRGALPLDPLTPEAVDPICAPGALRDRLEAAYESLERGEGAHRWDQRGLPLPPRPGRPRWRARVTVEGPDDVSTVIWRHRNQLAYCVQRLADQELLEVAPFTVRVRGDVLDGRFTDPVIDGAGVAEACIAGRFARMQLPEGRSGPVAVELLMDPEVPR